VNARADGRENFMALFGQKMPWLKTCGLGEKRQDWTGPAYSLTYSGAYNWNLKCRYR